MQYNKVLLKTISVLWLYLLAASAQAEYYGLKIGDMRLGDVSNVSGTPRMYSVVIGKLKGQGQAVEIEYSRTDSVKDSLATDSIYSIQTYALYSVARTDSATYFKSKIGYLLSKVTLDDVLTEDKGFSIGIGFGKRLGGTSMMELEYTIINSKTNFVSISYIF